MEHTIIIFKDPNQENIETVYDWLMTMGVSPSTWYDMRLPDDIFPYLGVSEMEAQRYSNNGWMEEHEHADTIEGFKLLFAKYCKDLRKKKLELLRGEYVLSI